MKTKASLALCIPAYNAANYLPKLLESAHYQAIPFDEILVYNDCSTDNTAEVAASYGAKVINGDINRGCSYGKNRLAEVTNCKWIHFHDADDILLSNFTLVAHQRIANPNSPEVILLNFEYRDFNTGELLAVPEYDLNLMMEDPMKFTITHKIVNFGIYKRKAFWEAGGFNLDERILYNEDAAFHHRLSFKGLNFGFEAEVTCINYRYNKSMSVSNVKKCHKAKFYVTENLLLNELDKRYPKEIAKIYWELASLFASVKDWEYSKKSINRAISITHDRMPIQERNWVLKYLCIISPFLAFYLREQFIRLFKPHLR